MNWFTKIIENINRKRLKNKEEAELKKSNYGRDFGWLIEWNGKAIGELTDPQFDDMFWVEYKIIAYTGFEKIVFDYKYWEDCKFEFRNKHYFQYAKHTVCGSSINKINNQYTVSMRGLYLIALQKGYN